MMNIDEISLDVAKFLNFPVDVTRTRLLNGFHYNHRLVAEDFINNNVDVNNQQSLLDWYRTTDAYIWELASYHLDKGFNYHGMCEGIALGLKHSGKNKVVSLGDGIGTLSIEMCKFGLDVTYHDLKDGKTANFAQFRFNKENLDIKTLFTDNWSPILGASCFDAVVALDFFEHLVNVEEWVLAVFNALNSGGVFIAQNAFAIGDLEHGNSIPMHLSVNNKYEKEWSNLLVKTGFVLHENGNWWIKP